MFSKCFAVLLTASSIIGGTIRNPLAYPAAKLSPEGPFATFVNHFDQHRVGTDIYLQTHLHSLYPNKSMVVTQDLRFRLLEYVSNEPTGKKIAVRQIEDIEVIKRTVYIPSPRRRDGDGVVVDAITFAGYEVAWGDQEFVAIVASWVEGYSQYIQWHLFGEDESAAHRLIHACAAFSSTVRDAVWVFEQSYWKPDYGLWQSIQKASWDDVVLDNKLKSAIQNDYRSFFKSEEVYSHLGVPWKRGLIFLGPPGNGKTISLKAIMKEVKVPLLYVKSFHTYGGDELGIRLVFAHARAFAPCVLVLEDLDSLITDQNRAFFLNEVDGLEDNDGLLLIGSTNHFDRLDPALSSRPSRFDRKYNFPNPSKEERRAYAVYWQEKLSPNKDIKYPDALLDDFAAKTNKFSFAYMKEAFISTLLTIAGLEETHGNFDFGRILLQQVKKLREQIDEETLLGSASYYGGGASQGSDDSPISVDEGRQDWGETKSEGIFVPVGQKVFGYTV